MSWPGQPTLLAIVLGYLIFLFLVATAGETFAHRLSHPRIRTVTYVLAASVYCSAWTFYGSVGLAANRGLEFLTIYLGPACVALLWPVLLRKLVRVSKEQRITSISDFISSRYGKSANLGTLVAVLVVAGMIPYIALQLRAVSASFTMILREGSVLNVFDPTLLVAVTLAFFGILFGARNLDFTKQQTGLMTAVAVESVVKLVAFLAVGLYVTWSLFGGPGDIFGRIAADPSWSRLLTIDQPQTATYARWAAMLLISMMAVMFLPRQFHVLVVQNPRERDVNAVAWTFPLYLLLINLFVLPIAFAGLIVFPESAAQADGFILRLPLHFDSHLVSVVVFLGGFSAATAMIVVESLALSKMITNDIILPMLLRRRQMEDIYWVTLFYTRVAMLAVVGLGFAWARMERGQLLLVEMGLLSFVAVTQCAPAILLGLYWRRGNRRGAAAGISAGFALWGYTLIIPALVKEGLVSSSVLAEGPFGLAWLRPTALFGLTGLDAITHGIFWSLFVNLALFVLVSLVSEQDADDRVQAAAFVGAPVDDRQPAGAPAILSATEIERLVHHYVGDAEAEGIVRELFRGKAPAELSVPELLELRIRFERLLAASLGAAAARMIVEDHFTISKNEAQELVTSFQQMQQSLRLTEEEVRRGERLLASVVQSVDDCIFTTGVDGRLVTMNPAGQRLLGYRERRLGRIGLPPVGALHLRRRRADHRHGRRLARPHRAGRDAAPAHPAREARFAGRDGGRRGPRDQESPGRHQDGDEPALVWRLGRRHAVAGNGALDPVGHRRDRAHHQQPAGFHARHEARARRVRGQPHPRSRYRGRQFGGARPRRGGQLRPRGPRRGGVGRWPAAPPGLRQRHEERAGGDRYAARRRARHRQSLCRGGPRRRGGRRQRRRNRPRGPG